MRCSDQVSGAETLNSLRRTAEGPKVMLFVPCDERMYSPEMIRMMHVGVGDTIALPEIDTARVPATRRVEL